MLATLQGLAKGPREAGSTGLPALHNHICNLFNTSKWQLQTPGQMW